MTIWPVLLASLAGSPHCAAMCGLVAGAAGTGRPAILAYQMARLAGYVALGTAAGALGSGADRLGLWIGLASGASRVAGIALVLVGVNSALALSGIRSARRVNGHAWILGPASRARNLPWWARATALGALTALLPCGWLYAFVIAAAGTGSAPGGAIAMSFFWLGTVPAVVGAGLLVRRLSSPVRARLPLVSAAILVTFGLLTAFGRPPATRPDPNPGAHVHRGR